MPTQALNNDTADADTARCNEQIALLRESAHKFCAVETHVPRSRRLRGTTPGFDREVWSELAGLGWLGILVPERFGGLGLGASEMAVICEAFGRGLLPEPLVAGAVLATGCVVHGDSDDLKQSLLPSFVSGELLPALAWREDGHDCDLLAVTTAAKHSRGIVRLSGSKRLVVGGAGADGFIVSARSAEGIGLYWVPKHLGVSGLTHIELADGRAAVELNLADIEVPVANRVAGPDSAAAVLQRVHDEALIATSAELLGVLSRAFEITLDYLRTRVQFGQLIGAFQSLQHRAVDLYAAQFMSRCTLDEVLAKIAGGTLSADERGALASRAKTRCADSSLRVTKEAVQMHGAMGFSDECDVGLYLKRALTLSAWLGGPDVHRRRFARLAARDNEGDA